MISPKEKRAVYKQWGEAFLCFKAYGTKSLYMTLDVAVVGIEFEPQHYEWAIGKLEEWRQELFGRLNHRDEILERIQRNMNEGKIAKLPRAHIAF